jgi:hypothetical protein
LVGLRHVIPLQPESDHEPSDSRQATPSISR